MSGEVFSADNKMQITGKKRVETYAQTIIGNNHTNYRQITHSTSEDENNRTPLFFDPPCSKQDEDTATALPHALNAEILQVSPNSSSPEIRYQYQNPVYELPY